MVVGGCRRGVDRIVCSMDQTPRPAQPQGHGGGREGGAKGASPGQTGPFGRVFAPPPSEQQLQAGDDQNSGGGGGGGIR